MCLRPNFRTLDGLLTDKQTVSSAILFAHVIQPQSSGLWYLISFIPLSTSGRAEFVYADFRQGLDETLPLPILYH